MTALSESFYLTSTHNIFSWLILTLLLFSWIGKPILDNGLSAQHMVKGPHPTWTPHKGGPKMCPSHFVDSSPQDLYYLENHPTMTGWLKGMQRIIEEHGLWTEHGLPSQCLGFKCQAGCSDCCACWVLFTQPDFGS